jgi:hypothetical protein
MMCHPIDAFLDVWAGAGGPDGMDIRRTAYKVLALQGAWDRTRLRASLCAVLAINETEAARFQQVFDAFFNDEPALESWIRKLADVSKADAWDPARALCEIKEYSARTQTGSTPVPSKRTSPGLPVLGVVLITTAVAVAVARLDDHAAITPSVVASEVPATSDNSGGTLPGGTETHEQAMPTDGGRLLWIAGWPLMVVAVCACAILFFWKRKARPNEAAVGGAFNESIEPDLRYGQVEPFTRKELDALAFATMTIEDANDCVVDVRATVRNTARSGGFFAPVMKSRRVVPKLTLVLEDSLDPVAETLLRCFGAGMRDRGVPVRIAGSRAAEDDEVRVYIVSGSCAHIAHASKVGPVVVLEARDPAFWGEEIATYPSHPQPLTPDGFLKAIRWSHSGARAVRAGVAPRRGDRERLGAALPLAAACAICAPCNIGCADALRRTFTPRVPFIALQRIAALRGVGPDPEGWQFEPLLAAWLVERVGDEFRSRVLSWNRTRLTDIRTKEGTLARAVLDREVALVDWQLVMLGSKSLTDPSMSVESILTRLEEQLIHPKLAQRMRSRGAAVALQLKEQRDADTITRSRLVKLGLAPEAPYGEVKIVL